MDSILISFFLTGFTGLLGYLYPGFPDESLDTQIAFGDKQTIQLCSKLFD
jgi:hypothetical protein